MRLRWAPKVVTAPRRWVKLRAACHVGELKDPSISLRLHDSFDFLKYSFDYASCEASLGTQRSHCSTQVGENEGSSPLVWEALGEDSSMRTHTAVSHTPISSSFPRRPQGAISQNRLGIAERTTAASCPTAAVCSKSLENDTRTIPHQA